MVLSEGSATTVAVVPNRKRIEIRERFNFLGLDFIHTNPATQVFGAFCWKFI
jgi:hypothetical protein